MSLPMMQAISLVTEAGGEVAQATLPPFIIPPTVVLFGDRTFVQDEQQPLFYREAFAYHIPPQMILKSTCGECNCDKG